MSKKKTLTKEQIYKRNQIKQTILRILTPIVLWGCLVGAVVCFVLAIKNSFGNVGEMLSLLDSKRYTGEQLEANYQMLIEKYGEWLIGHGNMSFTIKFINIKNVVFSGFMVLNFTISAVLLFCHFFFGKFLLPKLAKHIERKNQDMVNLEILKKSE